MWEGYSMEKKGDHLKKSYFEFNTSNGDRMFSKTKG